MYINRSYEIGDISYVTKSISIFKRPYHIVNVSLLEMTLKLHASYHFASLQDHVSILQLMSSRRLLYCLKICMKFMETYRVPQIHSR